MTLPILYSFRRCPYAMRARMGLMISGQSVELREIILRAKPAEMLAASAKGTVPILILPTGQVIEQSLDIMHWALRQNDPKHWLSQSDETARAAEKIVAQSDGLFKTALDRYKYHSRYDDADPHIERDKAMNILLEWNDIIGEKGCFFEKNNIADYAVFPFVRQFANHDRSWFDTQPIPHIHSWLKAHLNSDLFANIMVKYPLWHMGSAPIIFEN